MPAGVPSSAPPQWKTSTGSRLTSVIRSTRMSEIRFATGSPESGPNRISPDTPAKPSPASGGGGWPPGAVRDRWGRGRGRAGGWANGPAVACCFDICQPWGMFKQPQTLADLMAEDPCCPPLARDSLTAETAALLAPAFKALGDPVRLRLMSMIASAPDGEVCVCDLSPAFDLSGPTISHHLKTLRGAGLVVADRRGTWVYYRARPDLLRQLAALLAVDDPGAT